MKVPGKNRLVNLGRPCLYNEPMPKISVTLTPQHIELAQLIGGGNCSFGVRRAVKITRSSCDWINYITYFVQDVDYVYSNKMKVTRITISDELLIKVRGFANSSSEGIRMCLELFGYKHAYIDPEFAKKLDLIKRGLYEQK